MTHNILVAFSARTLFFYSSTTGHSLQTITLRRNRVINAVLISPCGYYLFALIDKGRRPPNTMYKIYRWRIHSRRDLVLEPLPSIRISKQFPEPNNVFLYSIQFISEQEISFAIHHFSQAVHTGVYFMSLTGPNANHLIRQHRLANIFAPRSKIYSNYLFTHAKQSHAGHYSPKLYLHQITESSPYEHEIAQQVPASLDSDGCAALAMAPNNSCFFYQDVLGVCTIYSLDMSLIKDLYVNKDKAQHNRASWSSRAAFSNDGRHLAFLFDMGKNKLYIHIFKVENWQPIRTLEINSIGLDNSYVAIHFGMETHILYYNDAQYIYGYNVQTQQLERQIDIDDSCRSFTLL